MKLKQMFDVKINRIVQIASLTGLAILALTSQPVAAANDGKSLPGAMCHEQLAGQASSVGRGNDGFFNFSTTITVTAECPIVRDGIINGGINAAYVRVADRSSAGDIVCTLYSLQSNGARQQVQTQASTVNTGVETLTFAAMQAADDGYYHLSCDLPPTEAGSPSRIISYRVDEEN